MIAASNGDTPGKMTKYFPILGWLPHYQAAWLRLDLVAGLTAGAVVIPQALAYATIAGLPVQVGLYVALVPMFVYALLGTSRRLSVSSTSALSIITGAASTPRRARRWGRRRRGARIGRPGGSRSAGSARPWAFPGD